jgi:hypothetical protein
VQPNPHINWVLGLREMEALKPTKTHYPSNPKPSFNLKREVKRESLKPGEEVLFAYFVAMLITWMSFASVERGLRTDILSMLETHIVMSSLSFRFILTLVFASHFFSWFASVLSWT